MSSAKKMHKGTQNMKNVKVLGQGQQRWFALLLAAVAGFWPCAGAAYEFPGMRGSYERRLAEQRALSQIFLAPQALKAHFPVSAVTNWHARGAWRDWVAVEFPDGFSFPSGFERLSGVTLHSVGEVTGIAATRTSPLRVAALPALLSLEPGVSSVTHGLTPSNSYRFAWSAAHPDRMTTNTVDAAIELFANGAIATMIDDHSTPSPYINTPAPVAPGVFGTGQDANWVRGNFALLQSFDPALTNVNQILDVGYRNWVEAWLGVNQCNGRNMVDVGVFDLPDDGAPFYLVCGDFKVQVTVTGSYRFPIAGSTRHMVRTYPDARPISLTYDDGMRGDGETMQVWDSAVPGRRFLATKGRRGAQREEQNNVHEVVVHPLPWARPTEMTVEEAQTRPFEIMLNVTNATPRISVLHPSTIVRWVQNEYKLYCDRVELEELVELDFKIDEMEESLILAINQEIDDEEPQRQDADIFTGVPYYEETDTNGVRKTYFTVATQSGSMDQVTGTTTIVVPTNQNCRVEVFMGTMESPYDGDGCYDDRIS